MARTKQIVADAEAAKRLLENRNASGRQGDQVLVASRTVRDAGMGSLQLPVLTRTNYNNWSMLMHVILQARGLWTTVDTRVGVEYTDDKMALEVILRVVSVEMVLVSSPTAKAAWDAVKTLRIGAERVKRSRSQTLRDQYEEIRFKTGESIDDFVMCLTVLVEELAVLDDPMDEQNVVLKILRYVSNRCKQLAWFIKSLVDLDTLSVEELTGILKVADDCSGSETDGDGNSKLLLREEE